MRTAGRALIRAALVPVLALVALLSVLPGQASAATYRVTMQGYAFAPASLTVPAGSTVTWTNQDTAPHDVKTTSGPVQIHSPMLNKGESWSFTFTTAGAYGYYCTVHPDMTAGITVQAPAPATSAAPTHSHTHTHTEPASGSGTDTDTGSARHGTGTGGSTTSSGRTPARTAPAAPAAPAAAPAAPGRTSPTPTASPPPVSAPQAQPATATTTATATVASVRPLDPLLLLAGIVAGISVLCLLLVGSRAAAPRGRERIESEA